jgi:hypothetical protein
MSQPRFRVLTCEGMYRPSTGARRPTGLSAYVWDRLSCRVVGWWRSERMHGFSPGEQRRQAAVAKAETLAAELNAETAPERRES